MIKNVTNLYNSKQKVIDLFNDCAKLNLKLCTKQKKEQGLKC